MPAFTVGLDLGQATDFSAQVVVEHVFRVPHGWTDAFDPDDPPPPRESVHEFQIRHMKRWALGTPYPTVVEDVAAVMSTRSLFDDGQLLYDSTGVGRAVGDMIAQRWAAGGMAHRMPWPVTFTQQSKRDMVSTVLVAIQRGRLRRSPDLPLADELEKDLLRFEQNIRPSGSTTYDVARSSSEDGHSDLATALMIALRYGEFVPFGRARLVAGETR